MAASPIQLLLPSPRHWPTPLPKRIATALGRADRFEAESGGGFGLPPSAALSRLGEGDLDVAAVAAHRWLRAEPAWIRPDINGARLYALGVMLPLDAEDVAGFVPDVQALLDDAGYRLEAATPQRWYVRMPRDAAIPRFATPSEALGSDPFDYPPEGEGQRTWRVLDNEVQIALHQHPRNAERQRAGLPPVNALWWWGDAALPDATSSELPILHSDDPLLRGLARLANMEANGLPTRWPDDAEGLYDLRGVRAEALASGWLMPALDEMERGKRMQWVCEDGTGFSLSAWQHWRFWRTPWMPEANDRAEEA